MLFFSGKAFDYNKKNICKTARNRRGATVLQDKSLQVPTPDVNIDVFQCLKKRVLPFISQKKHASISVEAAIALPMFVFFSLALLSPICWLDNQRKMQTEAEQICEGLSQWAYVEALETKEEMITYERSYKETIPFFSGIMRGVEMCVAAQRRKWIGLDGKLRVSQGESQTGESEEYMVYIGASMGRYHVKRDCHYISNRYESISLDKAKERRTSDGHRLNPCSACKPDSKGGGTVYVTTEGKHYHGSTDCSAMVSYVRVVPLRDVEHLGGCSYCASNI